MTLATSTFYFLLLFAISAFAETNIYSFTVSDVAGNEVNLALYRTKVLLVVNVASECGFTDNHYKELVKLDDIFDDKDFEILAFPCNQFGQQEPKKSSAVVRFASENYSAKFPIFAKLKTIGAHAHPLYKWLASSAGDEPQWNFAKYLIDRHGKVVKFISQFTPPLELTADIQTLIAWEKLGQETTNDEL